MQPASDLRLYSRRRSSSGRPHDNRRRDLNRTRQPQLRARMGDMDQQALIIYLNDIGERADEMGVEALDALLDLQEDLAQAIEPHGIGEVDGNEIATDDSEGSL